MTIDHEGINYAAIRLYHFNEGGNSPWNSLTDDKKKESLDMVKMIVGWYLSALPPT